MSFLCAEAVEESTIARIRQLKFDTRKADSETHHFDPVPIGIQDEREEFHLSVLETLFKRHTKPFEARARRLDVRHGDGDVAEPLRLLIARAVWRRFEVLRAMIVGKLEDA